jgi:hypothetical protein
MPMNNFIDRWDVDEIIIALQAAQAMSKRFKSDVIILQDLSIEIASPSFTVDYLEMIKYD